MESSAFSIYSIILSTILWRFYSFPTDLNNFYFTALITMVRTSVVCWQEEVGGRHLSRVQILARRLSVFRVESIAYGSVINTFSCVEICSLYTHCCKGFIVNGWIVSSAFSASMERIIGFFSLVDVVYHIGLHMLNHPCDSDGIKLVIVYDFLTGK